MESFMKTYRPWLNEERRGYKVGAAAIWVITGMVP